MKQATTIPMTRLSWLLLLLFFGGCQLPALTYEQEDSPQGRDNLARFLTNRAVTSFYKGDHDKVEESLEVALEIAPEFDEAKLFWKRRHNPYYRPGYLPYNAQPALPNNREIPLKTLRGVMYPIWGLPFDLVELPLKGLLCAPGLGVPLYPITFLLYPYPRKPRDPNSPGSISFGVGAGTSVGSGVGVGISGSPLLFFLLINGLSAMVYQSDWDDRVESWGRCGTWWWPWAAGKLHIYDFYPDKGVGSAFFANARRISVQDHRIDGIRQDLQNFRKQPIEAHNLRIDEYNRRILALPRKLHRVTVGATLAEIQGF